MQTVYTPRDGRNAQGWRLFEEGERHRRISPSPGTPGEGRGEGLFLNRGRPSPYPLPEYRERGPEAAPLVSVPTPDP